MATESRIDLSGHIDSSLCLPPPSPNTISKANALLQENHNRYHIFWSPKGFHNHIVHHVLSLFGLGTSVEDMQMQFERHTKRDIGELDPSVVECMQQPAFFRECLNKEEHYHNFLEFLRQQIRAKGYEAVVQEYLLSGTAEADDLLSRMFAGFLHPLIHLGFGIEFQQPAIVAEALAQAALHDNYLLPFFTAAENTARNSEGQSSATMLEILEMIRNDKTLSVSAHWEDGNKLRDGVLHRAADEMVKYASLWKVEPNELRKKTAEMVNSVVFYTAAAQNPNKAIKFDFYFMHCLNCSIFFWSFLEQPWLRDTDKARLLEWKGRTDLAMYASRRAPALNTEEFNQYRIPDIELVSAAEQWRNIFDRVSKDPEDGHASKLLRTLAWSEKLSKDFEEDTEFAVRGDMWLKIAHMAMDSVEGQDKRWVRSVGFEEAWADVASRWDLCMQERN